MMWGLQFKRKSICFGAVLAINSWAMYYVSAGAVRENITLAVMEHIARGNKALLVEFPELSPAEKGDHKAAGE